MNQFSLKTIYKLNDCIRRKGTIIFYSIPTARDTNARLLRRERMDNQIPHSIRTDTEKAFRCSNKIRGWYQS